MHHKYFSHSDGVKWRNSSINIRLYKQKPVTADWLLERGRMNAEMMDYLCQAMQEGQRILISDGTRTAKTTLHSAYVISFRKVDAS